MRVFISATTSDLKAYRQELASYLRRLNYEVEFQDDFSTDYRTIHDLLVNKIKPCDFTICLIGTVFGAAPADQPWDPPRSYTQLEYFISREQHKPTFLFFPASTLRLDAATDEPPDRQSLQQKYVAGLKSGDNFWYEFSDPNELNAIVAEAVQKHASPTGSHEFLRGVQERFPTPLAKLVADCLDGEKDDLEWLILETLRFLALVSAHDALCHGIFANDRAERIEELNLLQREMDEAEWLLLFRFSCPVSSGDRFISQLRGWAHKHDTLLEDLVNALKQGRAKRRGVSRQAVLDSLREAVAALYREIEFLQRYVVAAVSPAGENGEALKVRLYYGAHVTTLDLTATDELSDIGKAELYLLNIDQRSALPLSPALYYRPTASQNDIWGLLEFACSNEDHSGAIRLAPFSFQEPVDLKITPTTGKTAPPDTVSAEEIPLGWRFNQLWGNAADIPLNEPTLSLFDEASWRELYATVFPAGEQDKSVGGQFTLLGEPIHHGRNADIFQAYQEVDESADNSSPGRPRYAVHLLRHDSADNATIRNWFQQRVASWQELRHDQILEVHPCSDPGSESARPFFANQFLGQRSVEADLLRGRRFSDPEILEILQLAIDVCQLAHQQDLRLLSLPPRHFLIDEHGQYRLTGFDTLVTARDEHLLQQGAPLRYLQHVSRDWNDVAPELNYPSQSIRETADIFAIGMLLAKLRGLPAQPATTLPFDAWSRPWEQFLFHCLATQPAMRFQSMGHLKRMLQTICFDEHDEQTTTCQLVQQPQNTQIQIAENLVTNAEYLQFCLETHHPIPVHLRRQEGNTFLHERLSGPLCPVVNVHFEDICAYARWFSRKTGIKWRLLTHAEWLHAAGSNDGRDFAWGNETPHSQLANFDNWYGGTTVIGAFAGGISPIGCYDLCGNVWEWTSSHYFDGVPRRILKGGAYHHSAESLKLSCQDAVISYHRSPHVGFRLAHEGNL